MFNQERRAVRNKHEKGTNPIQKLMEGIVGSDSNLPGTSPSSKFIYKDNSLCKYCVHYNK